MAISAQSYENSLINALAVADPQMNTALGTPVRKIITAVAQEMSEYDVDPSTTTTLYSIDSVSGAELDYLVGQFGFTRQEARAARGSVTLRRDNGDSLLQIPYGSQFFRQSTATNPSVTFQTTAYQELSEGVLSAEIAIVATVAGDVGNVPANTITYTTTQVGYMSVTNVQPTTGGRDAETDDQLRRRFLLTVFRNVSGTSDQMLGLALAHEDVNKANLVTQESRYTEIVQATKDGDVVTATVSDGQWDLDVTKPLDVARRYWVKIPEGGELLSHGDYDVSPSGKIITFHTRVANDVVGPIVIDTELQLSHGDIVDCTVIDNSTGTVAAPSSYSLDKETGKVQILATIGDGVTYTFDYSYNFIGDGDFISVECDYLSKHNRGGIKTVDLYIDALSGDKVSDIQYVDFSKLITADNRENWVRDDGTLPTAGHIFVPLSYQPLYRSTGYVNMGTSIVLYEDKHFRMIYDNTGSAGSCRGMDAVEVLATVNGQQLRFDNDPSAPEIHDDTPINIPYYKDGPVEKVQQLIEQQRVVTMDVQVHEAKHRYFVFYLTLMYTTFPRSTVIEMVRNNLMSWAELRQFGTTVQFSDIETIAANTSGVDNVRVATEADANGALADYSSITGLKPGAYGIIELHRDGETYKAQYTSDFRMAQNEVLELVDVVVYSRTQQRWA